MLTDWSLTVAGNRKNHPESGERRQQCTGLATTGKGIQVVEAINGATTEEGAFVQGNMLQAGAFNYTSTGTVMRAGICAVKNVIVLKSPCTPPC
mgnify:CR=1 FL=1